MVADLGATMVAAGVPTTDDGHLIRLLTLTEPRSSHERQPEGSSQRQGSRCNVCG